MAQLKDLVKDFDFAINEECFTYNGCGDYGVFINAGKPVFNAEYESKYYDKNKQATPAFKTLCTNAQTLRLRTLVLPEDLDGSFRLSCN